MFLTALEPFRALFSFRYEIVEVEQKNWNQIWESNFEPLVIRNDCYVRATFHPSKPQYPVEIVIDPKMAFGTGHHQTTTMMMEFILEENVEGKRLLDMGAGTGILAILAAKRGCGNITAIDYDPICFDSILENSKLNNTPLEEVLCGSKEVIPDKEYDVILANINRNILLDQMDTYYSVMKPGAELYLSGFYLSDLEILNEKANIIGLSYVKHKVLENWCSVKYLK